MDVGAWLAISIVVNVALGFFLLLAIFAARSEGKRADYLVTRSGAFKKAWQALGEKDALQGQQDNIPANEVAKEAYLEGWKFAIQDQALRNANAALESKKE